MLAAFDDGRLQVTAAVSLLEKSRLVGWDLKSARFISFERDKFEQSWQYDVDPVFGRLICWIMFSVGAEFLAKGACLVRGVEIRTEKKVPCYPSGDIQSWASNFNKEWHATGTTTTTFFGTLGTLTSKGPDAPLSRLCSKACATNDQKELLMATYGLLQMTIRNRDAHAYVANVRDLHHWLVPEMFCKCFNLLADWLPGGPMIINKWRSEATSFGPV
ncbi:MAG: hypothetical protein ABL970_07675 [Nitrospira sp.]